MQIECCTSELMPIDGSPGHSMQGQCAIGNSPLVQPFTQSLHASCVGCGHVIKDASFLLVENNCWHVGCLKCSACAVPLMDSASCFVKNGSIYCHHDYNRLFSSRSCAHCGSFIEAHELVMRVNDRVYHANHICFNCCLCLRPLTTGEKFVADSTSLICEICAQPNLSAKGDFYDMHLHKPGRPRKRKTNITSQHLDSITGLAMNFPAEEIRSDTERTNRYQPQKSKRMRTSFKHHQLRAMKAYFNINHNPDAKDLKQLAQETGLTKRVLQVWFQNARAKYRRSCTQEDKVSSGSKPEEKKSDQLKKPEVASSCSDSFSSNVETSPDSDAFSFETTSHCDEINDSIMSPYHQQDFPGVYCNQSYLGSVTSSHNASSPTSSATSVLEPLHSITSPCQL